MSKRLVKMKNEKELLESGFKVKKEGDIFHNCYPTVFNFMKEDILGKILVITDVYMAKVGDKTWSVNRSWIKEELNPEDYPEYFV